MNAVPAQANNTDKICDIISVQEIQKKTKFELVQITDDIRTTHPHLSVQERRSCVRQINAVHQDMEKKEYAAHNAKVQANRDELQQTLTQLYVDDPNARALIGASVRADDKVVYVTEDGQRLDAITGKIIEEEDPK